jgi:hypothetical protein
MSDLFWKRQNFFSQEFDNVTVDSLVGHSVLLSLIFGRFRKKKSLQKRPELGPEVGKVFGLLARNRKSVAQNLDLLKVKKYQSFLFFRQR